MKIKVKDLDGDTPGTLYSCLFNDGGVVREPNGRIKLYRRPE